MAPTASRCGVARGEGRDVSRDAGLGCPQWQRSMMLGAVGAADQRPLRFDVLVAEDSQRQLDGFQLADQPRDLGAELPTSVSTL